MSHDEPVDGRCNAQTRDDGYCANYPKGDNDRCRMHGADSNGGAPEGNDNAATVGAWAEDFYEDFLTEAEKDRVMKSAEILGDRADTQEVGQHAASVCLEQFRRTGDERFMRRFESICDTFELAPTEEMDLNLSGRVDGSRKHSLDDETRETVREALADRYDVEDGGE